MQLTSSLQLPAA